MSPTSWPPLPAPSQVLSLGTPPRLDLVLAGTRDSQDSFFDLGEIDRVMVSGTVSPSSIPSLQPGLDNTPPHTWHTSGDGATAPCTPKRSQQTLFLHRILKSRAQASDGVSLAYRSSLGFSQRRSVSLDSSDVYPDDERLLAEAERTTLRDAETAEEEAAAEGEEEERSASRQNSTLSLPRRNPSRRQSRTSALSTGLPPVAEVPDTPGVLQGQTISRSVSIAASSSLDAQLSHGTPSRPRSSVVDQSGAVFPLLTSVNFGTRSTTSGTPPGSILLSAGFGSGSSNRTSRYPSLTMSSLEQSSHSGPDWHHPPSGLAGLNALQVGPLVNPHSPVEGRPEQEEMHAVPVPVKRAHLRESLASSIPEVKRMDVTQCEVARIDVAL
ncbi:hypothetical protein EV363DRAFT_1296201 [Boletus edulis]|nr:hypothetical protein EV363DRAFT_1296201 [Boletus edulis]